MTAGLGGGNPTPTVDREWRDTRVVAVVNTAAGFFQGDPQAEGMIRPVDLSEVNGRFFLHNAALGIHPHAVERRERYRREWGINKAIAVGYALLEAVWKPPLLEGHLQARERAEFIRTPFVFVGNLKHRLKEVPELKRIQTRSMTIDSRKKKLKVLLDGELVRMKPPLEFRVRPGLLRALIPPSTRKPPAAAEVK